MKRLHAFLERLTGASASALTAWIPPWTGQGGIGSRLEAYSYEFSRPVIGLADAA
jgi:hypothetical protein